MFKHTPGPWVVGQGKDSNAVMADGYYVATIHDDAGKDSTDETMGANARLIAAAPEMLDALLALNELQHGKHPLEINVMAAWALLDAAIAKATGETE